MGLILLFYVRASVSLLVMSKVSFLQGLPTQNVLHSCTCWPLNLGPRSGSSQVMATVRRIWRD